jgi:hypothetical protein
MEDCESVPICAYPVENFVRFETSISPAREIDSTSPGSVRRRDSGLSTRVE